MSAAAAARRRPPSFSTYVDVDVDIDPEDLEAAGWVYVGTGDDDAAPRSADVLEQAIRRNHDDEHTGPIRWCSHDLCKEVEPA